MPNIIYMSEYRYDMDMDINFTLDEVSFMSSSFILFAIMIVLRVIFSPGLNQKIVFSKSIVPNRVSEIYIWNFYSINLLIPDIF